jgi:hypothetical protein
MDTANTRYVSQHNYRSQIVLSKMIMNQRSPVGYADRHPLEEDILRAKTPGYMRMLTMSHRFIVPVQAFKFEVISSQTPSTAVE